MFGMSTERSTGKIVGKYNEYRHHTALSWRTSLMYISKYHESNKQSQYT